VVSWRIVLTAQAKRDAKKLGAAGLRGEAERLLAILRDDPYRTPPPFKKLRGNLIGACSRRISYQHRLVYQVIEDQHTVKVLRLWSHYE
jgi:Txe/YoeB family toxin of toxin-antitoxin system